MYANIIMQMYFVHSQFLAFQLALVQWMLSQALWFIPKCKLPFSQLIVSQALFWSQSTPVRSLPQISIPP